MKTILVVDDDPIYRAALQVILRQMGHHCRVAGSIHEMAEVLATLRQPPHLVILDWFLPDGTADQALRSLTLAALPAIVISASDQMAAIAARAIAAGALTVLDKATARQRLETAITQAIMPVGNPPLWIDPDGTARRLSASSAAAVRLSPLQVRLLRVLLDNPGITREELASRTIVHHQGDYQARLTLLAQRIHRLRHALKPLGVSIVARRNHGYELQFSLPDPVA